MHRAWHVERLGPHVRAGLPGLLAVGLMLLWAVHNGGYDAETWYWGALVTLAGLAATLIALGAGRRRLPRAGVIALVLFGLYVAWSYLSMAWAASPGDALQGSNRALLYLLLFTLLLVLPWTPQAALAALVTFGAGLGVIGIVLMVSLASADHVASLVIGGRLAAPTGYFNSTAALFTIDAVLCTALACRRELPGLLRGLLLAFGCAGLQLALIVQSRGWLFTLPLVALATIWVCRDRLRLALAAILPLAGALAPLHRLLDVFKADHGAALDHAAARAGQAGLLICGAVFVLGTLLAWGDSLMRPRPLSHRRRRIVGTTVSVAAIAAILAAGTIGTHGHPVRFVVRQWNGFSKVQTTFSSTSHFGDVGSGRYDFWRVSLDALLANPIGGLGQDNFATYYDEHGRTGQEPSWTHSLEMRLLAHTGLVGFALFFGFMVAALALVLRGRRRGDPLVRAVTGLALLPLVVWLIHGSIDWFWELPALSGPALGFLAMGGALGAATGPVSAVQPRSRAALGVPRPVKLGAAALAMAAAVVVLAFPYLSVREVSLASNIQTSDPAAALADLSRAAKLNPLSADPGRLAGAVALRGGDYRTAADRFRQSISADPGGWFAWLGAGLAASALGERQRAGRDFAVAYSIDRWQLAIRQALGRVNTKSPLTSGEAFKLLVLMQ